MEIGTVEHRLMIKSQQTIFFVTQVVSGINVPAKRSEFFFMV